jgi:hypothetical protein
MNHITQMNALEKQLKSFKNFVPFCSNDSLQELLIEMQRTVNRIENIRAMRVDKMVQEVIFQYETKQSKSNFKTYL